MFLLVTLGHRALGRSSGHRPSQRQQRGNWHGYITAPKAVSQSDSIRTDRDADSSCYPHASLLGGGTRPAAELALWWVIPKLPREPVQPKQRRGKRWRSRSCSELLGIPVQPEQRWWWWRFQWIPLDLLQQPCSKLPGKPVQPEQRFWRIWRISIWEIVDFFCDTKLPAKPVQTKIPQSPVLKFCKKLRYRLENFFIFGK